MKYVNHCFTFIFRNEDKFKTTSIRIHWINILINKHFKQQFTSKQLFYKEFKQLNNKFSDTKLETEYSIFN